MKLLTFSFALSAILVCFSVAPVFAQTETSDTSTTEASAILPEDLKVEAQMNEQRSLNAEALHSEYKEKAKEARRVEKEAKYASKQARKSERAERKAQKSREKAIAQKAKARKAAEKSDKN